MQRKNKVMGYFDVLGDEEELKWFFDNVIKPPSVVESYSFILSARFKKLTDEERSTYGITRRTAEFLRTEVVKNRSFANNDLKDLWTFEHFKRCLYKLNCDKRGYLTDIGSEIPDKCLVTMMTINPADDVKIADEIVRKINDTKTCIIKSNVNGKELKDNISVYQTFGQLESHFKHQHALCKGNTYWMDIDVDVPSWFDTNCRSELVRVLNNYFGSAKDTYVIIKTTGGYHILINTKKIKFDPHNICKSITELYESYVEKGFERYVDDKGNEKFECDFKSNQIPMVPLPGCYQYGNIVRVINKEDFEDINEESIDLINKTLMEIVNCEGLISNDEIHKIYKEFKESYNDQNKDSKITFDLYIKACPDLLYQNLYGYCLSMGYKAFIKEENYEQK